MKKPELLAPAGSYEKAKTAFRYGADAVYCGTSSLSLRTRAEMNDEALAKTIEYAHNIGKRVHVALNIFAWDTNYEEIRKQAKMLQDMKADGIIVADGGVVETVKEYAPNVDIHISTQANTVNWMATKFWYDLGVKRIVLARELTFKEINEITENIPKGCDIEAFIHGSMCVAYSGRCLISNYMIKRDANKGICGNVCRYKYYLVEETRPGEYYPVIEDDNGTYIMNSKDLCMIHHIPELVKSGIYSFKIEGRMKSEFYVASVVKAYREALDSYWENPNNYKFKDEWMDMLRKVSHRPYHTGFYLGINGEQNYDDAGYVRDYEIVGMVKSYDPETKTATVLQKNRVFEGEEVEILRPEVPYFKIKLNDMYDLDKDRKTDVANRAHMMFTVKVDEPLKVNDMLVKANNVININNN